jgi:Homeodomain
MKFNEAPAGGTPNNIRLDHVGRVRVVAVYRRVASRLLHTKPITCIKLLCDRPAPRFMAPASANLFRSESSSSLGSSSDERPFNAPNPTATKRSRKRFTGTQLTMLEHLFHCTSHPSREERESLARELDLYVTVLPTSTPPSPLEFFFFVDFIDLFAHCTGSPRS